MCVCVRVHVCASACTKPSVCSTAINLPSSRTSPVHLLIWPFIRARRSRGGLSLLGRDNLNQFPPQFISQATTHLVKQRQAFSRWSHSAQPASSPSITSSALLCLKRNKMKKEFWFPRTEQKLESPVLLYFLLV